MLRAEVTERNEGNTVGNQPYNTLFGKYASLNELTTPKLGYAYSIRAINGLSHLSNVYAYFSLENLAKVSETNLLSVQCYNKLGHRVIIL